MSLAKIAKTAKTAKEEKQKNFLRLCESSSGFFPCYGP